MNSNEPLLPIDKKFIKLQYAVSIYNLVSKQLRIVDNVYYIDDKLYNYIEINNYNIVDPELCECSGNKMTIRRYTSIDAVHFPKTDYILHNNDIMSVHLIKDQTLYLEIGNNKRDLINCKILFT